MQLRLARSKQIFASFDEPEAGGVKSFLALDARDDLNEELLELRLELERELLKNKSAEAADFLSDALFLLQEAISDAKETTVRGQGLDTRALSDLPELEKHYKQKEVEREHLLIDNQKLQNAFNYYQKALYLTKTLARKVGLEEVLFAE